MQETEDTVLFGKYQITGTLGTGRNGTVLLAVHLGLREYRAIKRVRKEQRPGVFLREAEILKAERSGNTGYLRSGRGSELFLYYRRISGRSFFICPDEREGQSYPSRDRSIWERALPDLGLSAFAETKPYFTFGSAAEESDDLRRRTETN